MAAEGRAGMGCTRTKGAAAASIPAGWSPLSSACIPPQSSQAQGPPPNPRPLSPTESTAVQRAPPRSSSKACLELPPPSSSPNLIPPWPSSQLFGCPSCQSGSWPWTPRLVTFSYLSCLVDSTTLSGTSFHPHSHCPRLGLSIPGLDHGSGPEDRGWELEALACQPLTLPHQKRPCGQNKPLLFCLPRRHRKGFSTPKPWPRLLPSPRMHLCNLACVAPT